jgi:hypothetical protein
MPKPCLAAAALLLLLVLAAPAAAQPQFLVGLRAGYADLSGDLYDRVYGESLSPVGAQVEARWTRWFARLAWETADADGFLLQPPGPPTLLPVPAEPTELSLDLLHATGGWTSSAGRWGWFLGAGLSVVDTEESNVLGRETVGETGYHAVAGGRVALGRRFEVGAEVLYLTVSDLFVSPSPSLSGDFDGVTAAATVAFRF